MTTTMNKTTIHQPDGTRLGRSWEPGTGPSLAWMQKAVGGYIEPLRLPTLPQDSLAYVNEEGLLDPKLESQVFQGAQVKGNVLVIQGSEFVSDSYTPVEGDLDLGEKLSEVG